MPAVFKNRAFLTLWLNQVFLQLSYNMLNFSLLILVFRLTNSNTVAATFVLMAMVPAILFGVFAGVVADRFDKRKILLITDIGIGAAMLLFIPVQNIAGLILLVAFLLNIVFQFFLPTEAAALPSIVPRENLLVANAIFQFTPVAALIAGASSAGPIVAHFGYNPVFVFGAASMLVTFFIRRALPSLPPEKGMAFDRARETFVDLFIQTFKYMMRGLDFIIGNNRVWAAIFILSFIQAAASTIAVLGPGFMEQILKIEATDASLILLLPVGIGLAFGSILVVRFGEKIPKRYLISWGLLLCGAALVAMALTPVFGAKIAIKEFMVTNLRPFSKAFTVSLWISLFAFLIGVGAAQVVIPAQTSLQTHTPSVFRGRVFAVWSMLIALGVAIPALAAGVVADIFGVVSSLVAVGVAVILVGLVSRFVSFSK